MLVSVFSDTFGGYYSFMFLPVEVFKQYLSLRSMYPQLIHKLPRIYFYALQHLPIPRPYFPFSIFTFFASQNRCLPETSYPFHVPTILSTTVVCVNLFHWRDKRFFCNRTSPQGNTFTFWPSPQLIVHFMVQKLQFLHLTNLHMLFKK